MGNGFTINMMFSDDIVRKSVESLLRKGNAHMTFEDAIKDYPIHAINVKMPGVGYTPWHLLEHMRRTQFDILDFTANPDYKELTWPDDYWPSSESKASQDDWTRTIFLFLKDREKLSKIALDPEINLYSVLPQGKGQNRLKELLVVADHNSYHLGEFAVMRTVMGTWAKNRKG